MDYIVALRGDPPEGKDTFEQTPGGFRYANELVELIHEEFSDFGVLVAGYPESIEKLRHWKRTWTTSSEKSTPEQTLW